MMYSPHLLLIVPIPVWMTAMTSATATMVAMNMINVIWLRQDMNTLRQDMNARFDKQDARFDKQDARMDKQDARMDRMETGIRQDIKELRDLLMKVLARDSVTVQ